MSGSSPFDRFDLDPRADVGTITERLRELAEDATSDAERAAIRAAWEELTLHPMRRLEAALSSFPETRPPLGAAPPAPSAAASEPPLDLGDLLPPLRTASALAPPDEDEHALLGPPPLREYRPTRRKARDET